jgi:DNA-binding transcriptional LysR family regulator
MYYTLHQLQIFTKVVETKSITKAAEELYMTQPAISIQLKKLQDQFDIPLTEIVKKRLRVTDFGMEIYRMSEKILSEVHAINYKTQAYKGLLSGRLSVSVVSTGKYVMPYFLSDFMRLHEGIDLIMDVTNKAKVIESLSNGDIDFALVSVLPDKMDVHEEVLMDNELYFVANKNFELAKNKLSRDELEKHALIYREEGSATRKFMEEYFKQKNLRARKKIELTSNEAVKQAIIAGLGISIMPIIGIREELKNKKLKLIPAAGLPIKTKWRLIWLKEKPLMPVAKEYIQYLRTHKEHIIKKNFDIHFTL